MASSSESRGSCVAVARSFARSLRCIANAVPSPPAPQMLDPANGKTPHAWPANRPPDVHGRLGWTGGAAAADVGSASARLPPHAAQPDASARSLSVITRISGRSSGFISSRRPRTASNQEPPRHILSAPARFPKDAPTPEGADGRRRGDIEHRIRHSAPGSRELHDLRGRLTQRAATGGAVPSGCARAHRGTGPRTKGARVRDSIR